MFRVLFIGEVIIFALGAAWDTLPALKIPGVRVIIIAISIVVAIAIVVVVVVVVTLLKAPVIIIMHTVPAGLVAQRHGHVRRVDDHHRRVSHGRQPAAAAHPLLSGADLGLSPWVPFDRA